MAAQPLAMAWFVGLLLGASAADAVAAALEVGQRAPEFALPATTGHTVRLAEFRGTKAVLVEFYGGIEFPVCSANPSARKVDHAAFEALGVQILGTSNEHGFTQKTFADSVKLPYPLLSDLKETIIKR